MCFKNQIYTKTLWEHLHNEMIPIRCTVAQRYVEHGTLIQNFLVSSKIFYEKHLLLLENNTQGGISSVMDCSYDEMDVNKKLLYLDANILYDWEMSQNLPACEFKNYRFLGSKIRIKC